MVELRRCHFFLCEARDDVPKVKDKIGDYSRSIGFSGLIFLHGLRIVVVMVGATAFGDASVFQFFREVASKALNSMDLIDFNGSLTLTDRRCRSYCSFPGSSASR